MGENSRNPMTMVPTVTPAWRSPGKALATALAAIVLLTAPATAQTKPADTKAAAARSGAAAGETKPAPRKPSAKAAQPPPATTLTAVRVAGSGPINDAFGTHWARARPVKVAMIPQTVTLPHNPRPAVTELAVRAVHNGGWIAFLIEWKDESLSNKIILDNFGDQVAVQLPIDTKAAPPSPMMGNAGGRVNIMQWRAAFQRDLDHGPPT
ncbi:MAG: hypothetical protein HYU51_06590, partial [Candidatus Rokubacteria bacterium]|nr:hypothetical protein [Candidatus Rokubacteria bacterium]